MHELPCLLVSALVFRSFACSGSQQGKKQGLGISNCTLQSSMFPIFDLAGRKHMTHCSCYFPEQETIAADTNSRRAKVTTLSKPFEDTSERKTPLR